MSLDIKTTVIIPNYNGIEFIDDCISSVLKEERVKVIVVDNASSDDSLLALKKYPDIELICLSQNLGFSAAVNIGIKAAQTPYVLLLNNDTEIAEGFVTEMENAMERHPNAFSISAQMRSMRKPDILDNAGDFYCALGWAYGYGKGKSIHGTGKKERRIFSACAGAAIYRREFFSSIGLFDEQHFAYLEDVDIGYRARINGYSNWYTPNAVVYHAGSAVSGSQYNLFKLKLSSRNSIYLIEKNMPFLQIVLNLPLLILGFLVKTIFFARKKMAKEYLKGLWSGIRLYYIEGGKEKHVPFHLKYLPHYLKIQLELWLNVIRRIGA